MAYDADSREAQLGALAESEAARIMQARGAAVLPVYSLLDNAEGVRAPMVLAPRRGLLIGPDLICFASSGNVWVDVKGKAVPSWRRTRAQWEHGIDYAHFVEYGRVGECTRLPVWLLLRESKVPSDPDRESPLIGRVNWLTISLADAERTGERRADWPGGRANPNDRGARGEGGWLWPRSAMRPWSAA